MIEIGQKRFNTTGPCFPNKHYMLEALARLPNVESFVADERIWREDKLIDGKTIHCYGV